VQSTEKLQPSLITGWVELTQSDVPTALRNMSAIQRRFPNEIRGMPQSTRQVKENLTSDGIESNNRIARMRQSPSVNRRDEGSRTMVQTSGGRSRESLRRDRRRMGLNLSKHGRLFGQLMSRKPFKKDIVA
jgi:hypothetical protein